MSARVLFYVQHLLGIGHVVRSARIARALGRAGFDVTIAYGGLPVPDVNWGTADLVQLPAVTSGPEGFGSLVDQNGHAVTDALRQARTECLGDLLSATQPDVLLIEAYPFARRIMRSELLPLLLAAHSSRPKPIIVSSIRDILQEGRKPERITETRELVERFFDAVLVHGSEEFAPLTASFPEADLIASKLHYTGWVGPEADPEPSQDQFEVIVSAGGGAVGAALFETALGVRAGSEFAHGRWLVLAGPNLSDAVFRDLSERLPPFVTLERFRSDLPALLRAARVSVSQAGYNTVADVLTTGCRAVLVPYAENGETEQTRRAQLLQAQGRAVVLAQAELSVEALSTAIGDALRLAKPAPVGLMNGAKQTALVLRELVSRAKQ